MVRNKIIRGAAILAVGRMVGYLLSFVRNLIFARLLTKDDFGLAALFATAVSLFEMSSRLGVGQRIIQSEDGDSPAFQDTAHTIQVGLGAVSAVLVAGLSVPIAALLGAPQAWLGVATLSVVPLLNGFTHLDAYRFQRQMAYFPVVAADVIPQVIVTALAWPMAHFFNNYWGMICAIVLKSSLSLAVAHILAERSFRMYWCGSKARSIFVFGWPLIINGFLILASQQADQILIGSSYSTNVLASYALAFSLVSIPWYIFGQVSSSIMLPILASVRASTSETIRRYRQCLQVATICSVAMLVPLLLVGEQLVVRLYGSKYSGTGMLVMILGSACALRFLRLVPALAAMSRADTLNQLYSNLSRCANLPLGLVAVYLGGDVHVVAACTVVGEVAATFHSLMLLKRRAGINFVVHLGPFVYLVAFFGIAATIFQHGSGELSPILGAVSIVLFWMSAGAISCMVFPEIRVMFGALAATLFVPIGPRKAAVCVDHR